MINIVYMIMPVITLIMGFYFGFRIGKDKEIPKVEIKTPTEIIEEHKDKKDAIKRKEQQKKEEAELEAYLGNLNRYPYNQVKINKE